MDYTGDANPANKLLMESGKRSVLKRSRPTESPRKMSYLALDRGTAKPPFVGSNPTRASKLLVSNQWITAFVSFPASPIWEQLGKEPLLDSRLHAGMCLESHAYKSYRQKR